MAGGSSRQQSIAAKGCERCGSTAADLHPKDGGWFCGQCLLAFRSEAEQNDGPMPDYFIAHVVRWLVSNEKHPSDVRYGWFPLGMVQRWIERAEEAEAERDKLKKAQQESRYSVGSLRDFVKDWEHLGRKTFTVVELVRYVGSDGARGGAVDEFNCQGVKTWRELCEALTQAGLVATAGWIESWQDEYLPGHEDEPLPRELPK